MPTVYIETTVPSYYFETRRTAREIAWRATTRRWWDDHRSGYRVLTSEFVLRELALAPAGKRAASLALLQEVEILSAPPRLEEVIEAYVANKLMPGDALGDAAHLVMCSLHAVDFLLTWNCRHLANANKFQHLRVVNRRLGLPVPIL